MSLMSLMPLMSLMLNHVRWKKLVLDDSQQTGVFPVSLRWTLSVGQD